MIIDSRGALVVRDRKSRCEHLGLVSHCVAVVYCRWVVFCEIPVGLVLRAYYYI